MYTNPVTAGNRLMETMLRRFPPVDFREYLDSIGVGGNTKSESPFEPTLLDFAAGQPDSLFIGEGTIPYRGQESAKKRLNLHISAMQRHERLKVLFTGPAGTGKTTLARIIGRRIQRRHWAMGVPEGSYFEVLPAQLSTKDLLDQFMSRLVQDPYATVFLDEIHTLSNLEALFHVLHDTGAARYPMTNGSWIEVPSTISWLTATTDPGELDKTTGGAMRRRLEPEIRLEAPGKDVLADIVKDQGKHDALPVDEDAAKEIATRSVFPWQAKMIYGEAKLVATVGEAVGLHGEHAQEAFDIMELDERGLLREDRDVIRSLLMTPYELASKPGMIRYRMAEEALCAAAGVDRGTYKKRIQPKLMRLGLLTTVGGQSLTTRAVEQYGSLVQ